MATATPPASRAGGELRSADLKNGDRFELGEHEFQFVLEKRQRSPKTYVVEDD